MNAQQAVHVLVDSLALSFVNGIGMALAFAFVYGAVQLLKRHRS